MTHKHVSAAAHVRAFPAHSAPAAMQHMCSSDWQTANVHDPLCSAATAIPPNPSMAMAREEFETVMFTTVQDLLDKTGGCVHVQALMPCFCFVTPRSAIVVLFPLVYL